MLRAWRSRAQGRAQIERVEGTKVSKSPRL
jgi:hypothetical protein